MTSRTLVSHALRHFWRTHLAVIAGVAVAVSVLGGALLVGESVRSSLRGLVDERLGRTDIAVSGAGFFRQALAGDVEGNAAFRPGFAGAVTMIVMEGAITHASSGREAARVAVYGIDSRFFAFHGVAGVEAPSGRQALLSPALASELGAAAGDGLLLRVRKPSAIPADSLAGRRQDTSRAIRLTVSETLAAGRMGEFTLRPQQDAVRAVFVPIARLQRDLDLDGRANALLLRAARPDAADVAAADRLLGDAATLEDLGLRIVRPDLSGGPEAPPRQHALVVESDSGTLRSGSKAGEAAEALGFRPLSVYTYVVNVIRKGDRQIPYSVITGLSIDGYDGAGSGRFPASGTPAGGARLQPVDAGIPGLTHRPIWLNEWAARELETRPNDDVEIEYFVWSDDAGLKTERRTLSFAGVVAMSGAGGDRTLTPSYPGLTDAPHIGDWDPPFPVDLTKVRPADEKYWEDYRGAPKAFVTPSTAQELWGSPAYGALTSIRAYVAQSLPLDEAEKQYTAEIRRRESPADAGLVPQPVRAHALAASRGATDFGEYFTYFSFFLVISGLLLSGLFFKLGLEQRVREVGLLYALGFTPSHVRRLLGAEALVLAVIGAAAGMAGAVGFAAAILYGLRTWWVDAVGTTRLTLAVTPMALLIGALGGLVAALVTLLVTLRRLGTSAPKDLLSGLALMASPAARPSKTRPALRFVIGLALAVGLALGGALGYLGQTAAFFAAGGVLLVALLLWASAWLRARPASTVSGHGALAIGRLGIRQATANPGRSVLSIALIAFATFVIVSVGAFRRGAPDDDRDPSGGTGGYTLFAESVVPVMFDPATPAGRAELGLGDSAVERSTVMRFRLRPGEDGSCLNLYKPTSPRIIAPAPPFVEKGGFRFSSSMAETEGERQNPWRLLDRQFADGAVPVIGDANSLQYVLHVGVGDELTMPGPSGQPLRFRVVAALSDSLFQSELIIAEAQFVRIFPRIEGYRFFAIRPPQDRTTEVATALERSLADYGFDAQSASARIAAYHRVENTYLSTFQALGALGLLLGTLGLGAILLRNVLERRRELALLQAVGYERGTLSLMVVVETVMLLVAGMGIGVISAVIAVAPALAARASTLPIGSTLVVLSGVFIAGLCSSIVATRAAGATPLLESLKAE